MPLMIDNVARDVRWVFKRSKCFAALGGAALFVESLLLGLKESGNVRLHSVCSAGEGKDAKRPAQ